MNYLEVIEKYGKMTEAQVMANNFYAISDDAKNIEYESASASIFVEQVDLNMLNLLKDTIQNYPYVNVTLFPNGNYIEIWFC